MRKPVSDALTEDTSTDPVIRRLLRKRALLQAAEDLDRDFHFDIEHPSSHMQTPIKPPASPDAAPPKE